MAFDGRTDHQNGMKIKVHMSRYIICLAKEAYLTNKK